MAAVVVTSVLTVTSGARCLERSSTWSERLSGLHSWMSSSSARGSPQRRGSYWHTCYNRVSTCATERSSVWIPHIQTPRAWRRGIGALMTLAALRDAGTLGYRIGVLGASSLGYPVYQRLGLREYCTICIYEWHSDA